MNSPSDKKIFEKIIPVQSPRQKKPGGKGFLPQKPGIPLVSEMNTHEFWRKSHERHQKQKRRISQEFMLAKPKITLPIEIRLTRSTKILTSLLQRRKRRRRRTTTF